MTQTQTANDLAQQRTDLAIQRTAMAADRSLMAWVRTGLSLISFGFTIYKFLDQLRSQLGQAQLRPEGPRQLGMFLITLGTVGLVFGMVDYFKTLKSLQANGRISPWRFTLVMAGLIAGLGLVLLIGMITRRELM